MPTNEELLQRIEALEQKSGKLNFPVDPNSQGAIEQVTFKTLKTLVLKAGLQLFTTATRDVTINKPMQAEMWMEKLSSSPIIEVYINGTKYNWTSD